MDLFLEISYLRLSDTRTDQIFRGRLQEFGYKPLYFRVNACVIQRRYQFRLLDMRESATQRTLHQIIVYHGCPPRGFIALLTGQLDDEPAPEAVTTVSCASDGNHAKCMITEGWSGTASRKYRWAMSRLQGMGMRRGPEVSWLSSYEPHAVSLGPEKGVCFESQRGVRRVTDF